FGPRRRRRPVRPAAVPGTLGAGSVLRYLPAAVAVALGIETPQLRIEPALPSLRLELDLALVRKRDRADEPERAAVAGREVADRDSVARLDRVRPIAAESEVRERIGGARRQHPF